MALQPWTLRHTYRPRGRVVASCSASNRFKLRAVGGVAAVPAVPALLHTHFPSRNPSRDSAGGGVASIRRRGLPLCRAEQQQQQGQGQQQLGDKEDVGEQEEMSNKAHPTSDGNGVGTDTAATITTTATTATITPAAAASSFPPELLEGEELPYREPDSTAKFWTSFKLAFALPWRRFKKNSVLSFKLEGEVSDQQRSFFDPGLSMPALCTAMRKAALDPRIQGLAIEIGPLGVGWGKVQEIKRHIEHFRCSGKYVVAWMKSGGEKEYYLACACSEVYAPPCAAVSLRGFVTGGSFLRGVLDKAGVEPQVERIGRYKSAGDQLLRRDMAPEQREQLGAIQADVVEEWLRHVAAARGKTREEVVAFVEEGVYDMARFKEGGWVTDLWYEDQLIEELKMRTTGLRPRDGESEGEVAAREKELSKPLRRVGLRKYGSVDPGAFGLGGGGGGWGRGGGKKIAVLRTSGAILGKSSGAGGSNITPDSVIPKLRALARDKSVAAVVLRIDSPGGDALASDLMWREVVALRGRKPVVASMADVAASGGYYLAMGASAIVAEPLTITGSIGVVTGKFNLAQLYDKIGYSKELISWGRFAQLLADNRPFTQEEAALFSAAAQHAYTSFRDKAAASRGMRQEEMQAVAQGRVWSGTAAKEVGLVDALGGLQRAVRLAAHAAGLPPGEQPALVEVGRPAAPSPAALLGAGAMTLLGMMLPRAASSSPAAAAAAAAAISALSGSGAPSSSSSSGSLSSSSSTAQQLAALASAVLLQEPGRCAYLMTDVDATSVACSSSCSSSSGMSGTAAAVGSLMGGGLGVGGGGGAYDNDYGFLSEGEQQQQWGEVGGFLGGILGNRWWWW
ncbi:hypothetical protein Agub_g5911 [Astrephomene gubernaculifera]|uniref:Peptidase S49 domain-containing protein n=1 Tax=Astrephomene gubernaculifera TaxID=47775 RepID=A0AAD3DN23_9CHLO|nr:hypothetical protein Agub_g5911 [Astrephomene gubernaculifera]